VSSIAAADAAKGKQKKRKTENEVSPELQLEFKEIFNDEWTECRNDDVDWEEDEDSENHMCAYCAEPVEDGVCVYDIQNGTNTAADEGMSDYFCNRNCLIRFAINTQPDILAHLE
jgi:hypothetical protein